MNQEDPSREDAATTGHSEELTVSPERALSRARWAEVVFVSCLIVYAILAILAHRYAYFAWDVAVAERVQSIHSESFKQLMIWISAFGTGWLAAALVVGAGVALILARFRLEGLICMVG